MKLWSFINEEILKENLENNPKIINNNTIDYIIVKIKMLKKEGFSKNKIRIELDKFLEDNLKGFVVADWDKKLQRLVNKYTQEKNCNYKKGKRIKITEEELNLIKEVGDMDNIKSIEIEKILFIMLVLAKSTQNDENKDLWCNYKSSDIFKLARYKYKTKSEGQIFQREYLLHSIKEKYGNKYIEFCGENIKLNYGIKSKNYVIDEDFDNISIENVILKYLDWRNLEGYKYCTVCGKEIKLNSKNSRAKYCNNCGKKVNIKKTNSK